MSHDALTPKVRNRAARAAIDAMLASGREGPGFRSDLEIAGAVVDAVAAELARTEVTPAELHREIAGRDQTITQLRAALRDIADAGCWETGRDKGCVNVLDRGGWCSTCTAEVALTGQGALPVLDQDVYRAVKVTDEELTGTPPAEPAPKTASGDHLSGDTQLRYVAAGPEPRTGRSPSTRRPAPERRPVRPNEVDGAALERAARIVYDAAHNDGWSRTADDDRWRKAARAVAVELGLTGTQGHQARRDDDVARWLKQHRDLHRGRYGNAWEVLDEVLDDYRLHADTGTPLDEHACDGPNCCPSTQGGDE